MSPSFLEKNREFQAQGKFPRFTLHQKFSLFRVSMGWNSHLEFPELKILGISWILIFFPCFPWRIPKARACCLFLLRVKQNRNTSSGNFKNCALEAIPQLTLTLFTPSFVKTCGFSIFFFQS